MYAQIGLIFVLLHNAIQATNGCCIECQNDGIVDPLVCRCICPLSYFGERCQFQVPGSIARAPCEDVCQNGGRTDPASSKCVCHPSGLFTGDRCETVNCQGKSDQLFCEPDVKQWICLDPIIGPACPILCEICPTVTSSTTNTPTSTTKTPTTTTSTTCPSPPSVDNADVDVQGEVALYKCRRGFGQQQSTATCLSDGSWTDPRLVCTDAKNCIMLLGRTAIYRGTMATTESGLNCQAWTSISPNRHRYGYDRYFFNYDYPETAAQAMNYCRDPSGSGRLWCYSKEGTTPRWGWCPNVPQC